MCCCCCCSCPAHSGKRVRCSAGTVCCPPTVSVYRTYGRSVRRSSITFGRERISIVKARSIATYGPSKCWNLQQKWGTSHESNSIDEEVIVCDQEHCKSRGTRQGWKALECMRRHGCKLKDEKVEAHEAVVQEIGHVPIPPCFFFHN